MLVLHLPNGREIHELATPLPGEWVGNYPDAYDPHPQGDVGETRAFRRYLKKHGIETLLYAGFSADQCLTWTRPTSIAPMAAEGFNVIMVRDATTTGADVPFDLQRSIEQQVEVLYGATTTTGNVVAALTAGDS